MPISHRSGLRPHASLLGAILLVLSPSVAASAWAADEPLPQGAAAKPAPVKGAPAEKSEAKSETKDLLGGLKVRLLGPAWGGRASAAVGVPGDPRVYYL